MNDELVEITRRIIRLLVDGRYKELEDLSYGIRLSAREMSQAIDSYGAHLVMPPDDAYRLLDCTEIVNVQPPEWSIVLPLWTREEGRSDLSLELTIIAAEQGFTVEIDDIHVL